MRSQMSMVLPKDWEERATYVAAPPALSGEKAGINLVVKKRPSRQDPAVTVREYIVLMKRAVGELIELEAKQMKIGPHEAYAIRFAAEAVGKKFRQMTVVYQAGPDEISATVTQLDGDGTSAEDIEHLLASVQLQPAETHFW